MSDLLSWSPRRHLNDIGQRNTADEHLAHRLWHGRLVGEIAMAMQIGTDRVWQETLIDRRLRYPP